MKHVNRNTQGVWKYRRRVPGDIVGVIGKTEFKGMLGNSHKDALRAWPKFHAEIENQIAAARRGLSKSALISTVTPRKAFQEALKQFNRVISSMPLDGEAEEDGSFGPRDIFADSILADYPEDAYGQPVGVPLEQTYLVNMLRTRGKLERPRATLTDALRDYLAERFPDGKEGPDRTAVASAERSVGLVVSALDRDPVLSDLTRDDARVARDYMLDRFKANGQKVSVATVERELNNVRAVVGFAISECMLEPGARNVFERLSMPSMRGAQTDAEKRDPLPQEVLEGVSRRIAEKATQKQLVSIWQLLAGTGCRLSEVTGLRRVDVIIGDGVGQKYPHLRVAWHENRRLKTQSSMRCVPLVGEALVAAKGALEACEGEMLLPSYGGPRGGDSASQALMKHVRGITSNPKHVVHSLRHNMKDRLDLAQTPELVRNLIMGWSLDSVGNRVYGGETAKLIETTRAMNKAFGLEQ